MKDFLIRNNRFTYLVMFSLIIFGLYSAFVIPKESAPEVQIPVGIVTTVLPGASALDVENLVTNEIERNLDGSLDDVEIITSSSREGVSIITVEFSTSADIDDAIRDLRDEVDTIRNILPSNAEDPTVSEISFVDQPIFSLAVSGDRTDEEFIEVSREIKQSLEDIPGVSRVETRGVREREIHVLVDQASARNFGLTVGDIARGIESANTTLPIGEIVSDNVSYNIIFENKLQDASDLPNLPIAERSGQPVLLREVAQVIDGTSIRSSFSRLSITPAPSANSIVFDIYKQRTGDIISISGEVHELIDSLQQNSNTFSDLDFYTILDTGELIVNDLTQLTTSGIQTAVLVSILLIITLGWREGIITGLAIPLSFMIGFIGLWLSGNTINFISLFALILGIGILVDSSIVMVEGVNKRLKQDITIDKTRAAVETISAFAKPVTAGTLTTVAMFSGLFIVSGVTGEFIKSIPFTLISILLASLLVAIGFIPLLSATFLKRRSNTLIEKKQIAYANALENWYSVKLKSFLDNTKQKIWFTVLLLGGFVLSFALIPLGFVQVIFFGSGNADNIFIEIELPVSSVYESTDKVVREVEEVLYQTDDITAFSVTVGSGSAFLGQSNAGGNIANINVLLDEDRTRDSNLIREEIQEKVKHISNADITISQPEAGPPTGSPIGINLFSDNLNDLTTSARIIADTLKGIEYVTNIDDGTDPGASEFVFSADPLVTSQLGVQPIQIPQTLRTAIVGIEATTINTLTEEIPITVRLDLQEEAIPNIDFLNYIDVDTLENLTLFSNTGNLLIIGSMLNIDLQESRSVINHQDKQRVLTVRADVQTGGNVREINRTLVNIIDNENILPEDVSYTIAGETGESDQGFLELFLALIVGTILMIGVLVLQFNSYRYPLYVLSIVPFSLMGILYGLAIVGSPLSFPSIMGFIALTGIVVNNSILLIDMINMRRKENENMSIRDAVVKASASRVRPILLTTITTVLGISPLLFTDPIWVPLATAIMFGLSFSVIITLVLVPMIYDKYPGKIS